MKRLILLLFLYCWVLNGNAKVETASDSLLQIYRILPCDTARLSTLCKVIKIEQNTPKCIELADTLMKEAQKLKDNKYSGLSAYYHIIYYYNQCQPDSVAKWIKIMEPFVQKSDIWDFYFDAKRFQVDLYTYEEKYELAIHEAEKIKSRAIEMNNNRGMVAAYQCLSNAYIGSQRWDEGIKALEEAYHLLEKKGNPIVRISVLTQLISTTKEKKDYTKMLKYLHEQENLLNHHLKANPALREGFYNVLIFNELFYAHYFLNIIPSQLQKSREHLEKARKYLTKDTYFMYKIVFFDTYADYFQHAGEYQVAANYLDTTLNMLKKDYQSDYAEQLLKKAKIWVKAGESNKALPLYQEALEIKDSASMMVSNTQMEQIKNNYHVDKISFDQRKQNNEITLICLIVILIILFALFIIMYHASQVRHALKQSESEIRKAARMVRNANEMKNRFLTNMSYNIRTPLNNVVGFSQIIASEPEMDEKLRKEYSHIVHQSSEYLMKLVNDVLDLSRLEAHMMRFQIQTYDAVALCNEACYMSHMRNEKTGIQIKFLTEIEMQEILTDTGRLTQLLLSTLTYSQEYQEDRTIQLTLSKIDDMLYFHISNTPLADLKLVSQETHIRNDINRLLVEHFGGVYQVNPQTPEGPEIVFTYPITPISE